MVAEMVKNLPAVEEIQVWSLGQEDPLEEGMTTHSNIVAWAIPWTEEPGGLQSTGSQTKQPNSLTSVRHDWATNSNANKNLTPPSTRTASNGVPWRPGVHQVSLRDSREKCKFNHRNFVFISFKGWLVTFIVKVLLL